MKVKKNYSIKDAMKLVISGNNYGTIIYKGEVDIRTPVFVESALIKKRRMLKLKKLGTNLEKTLLVPLLFYLNLLLSKMRIYWVGILFILLLVEWAFLLARI